MTLINIFLTDVQIFSYNTVIIEVTKVLLVSLGWIGGLTAFVYWKDKQKKNIPVSM